MDRTAKNKIPPKTAILENDTPCYYLINAVTSDIYELHVANRYKNDPLHMVHLTIKCHSTKVIWQSSTEKKTLEVFDHQIHQILATDVIGVSFDVQ